MNPSRIPQFLNMPYFLCSEGKHPFLGLSWSLHLPHCLQTWCQPTHCLQGSPKTSSQLTNSFCWSFLQAFFYCQMLYHHSNHYWQGCQCCSGHQQHQHHHLQFSLLRNSQKGSQKTLIQGCGEEEKALAQSKAQKAEVGFCSEVQGVDCGGLEKGNLIR